MRRKIFSRLISTIVVLLGVSIIAFLLPRLGGGDPAKLMLPSTATEAEVKAMHEKMGLDEPYIVQYTAYMKNVLSGDFGYSYYYGRNVSELISLRLPNTAKLAVFGLIVALLIAVPLGVIAGTHKGSGVDVGAMFFAIVGQSMSPVWLACFLILVFGVYLGWLPTQGMDSWKCWILPGLCIGFDFAASQTRTLRAEMIDVLGQDYITAIRARGISEGKINRKYALKNALLPLVTLVGGSFGAMFAGSMVIENMFSWPGLGQLMVIAINSRDYQLVQSLMLISALILVACNLIADIAYTFVDPRISFN